MPFLFHFGLKPYQKKRISVFLGYGSPAKERYQIEQSSIAIGSGGLFGKGIFNGTQNKFKFLPESRTDFIFATLCEEWGLCGACFLLILYMILFWHMLCTIASLYDPMMQVFATGVILHIILGTIINIAMVIGFLPIVGIPLPFMSYGISNLWVTWLSVGFYTRITMQQKAVEEYTVIKK